MDLKIPVVILGTYEGLLFGLAQAQLVPDGLWDIAKELPVLALFLATLYYLTKWGSRMLEAQRAELREIYENNQKFLSALLDGIITRQDKMDISIETLAIEIRNLHATLGELTKVDDVIEQMIDRIGRRKSD